MIGWLHACAWNCRLWLSNLIFHQSNQHKWWIMTQKPRLLLVSKFRCEKLCFGNKPSYIKETILNQIFCVKRQWCHRLVSIRSLLSLVERWNLHQLTSENWVQINGYILTNSYSSKCYRCFNVLIVCKFGVYWHRNGVKICTKSICTTIVYNWYVLHQFGVKLQTNTEMANKTKIFGAVIDRWRIIKNQKNCFEKFLYVI